MSQSHGSHMGLFYSVCLLLFFPDLFQDPPKFDIFQRKWTLRYRFEGRGRIPLFFPLVGVIFFLPVGCFDFSCGSVLFACSINIKKKTLQDFWLVYYIYDIHIYHIFTLRNNILHQTDYHLALACYPSVYSP